MSFSSTSLESKPPIIFVSYSHDGKEHCERVLRLAARLREKARCDCRIDRDAEASVTSWPRWMRKQIKEADFVIMVFTRNYRRRFDGEETQGRGRGVTWEGSIIENLLYAAAAGPTLSKFIPVVFYTRDAGQVPADVFSGTIFRLPADWERLVRRLQTKHPQNVPRVGRVAGESPLASKPTPEIKLQPPNLSVLFVGAEKGTGLDLHGQLTKTRAAIAKAKFGQVIKLNGLFNLTLDQLLMELNSRSPEVLHLSGKQEQGQVKMHDASGQLAPVSADQLAKLLGQYICGSIGPEIDKERV